tara:strand:+ start:184 stop:591 length:408 start_codon:yes stop_codon:yes gene_type:complete
MFNIRDKITLSLIFINVLFLFYFSFQLLILTDEFALKNLGFFNHAVAGLSEIIGIIFFCLGLGLISVIIRGSNNQFPLFSTIFLMEAIISLNFWRYVITNSPGETNIETITLNAYLFSLMSFLTLIIIVRQKKFI